MNRTRIDGQFENISIQVTRCDTSHVCSERVMLDLKLTTSRPSLPQFTGKKKGFFHSLISHLLETMKYEVGNEILSLKRLNNRNATDHSYG